MSTKSKITILICFFLLIVTAVLYVIVAKDKPVELPKSNLVNSIFEAQNSEYKSSSALSGKYSCVNFPYTVDVPDAESARMGDGIIYAVNQTSCIYLSEMGNTKDLNSHIMEELPKAILFDYDISSSTVEDISKNTGYINGFEAEYFIKGFTVCDTEKTQTKKFVVIGYNLKIKDFDRNLVVAVTSLDTSNEAMASCKDVLDTVLYTIQYSDELNKILLEKKDKEEDINYDELTDEEILELEMEENENVYHRGEGDDPDVFVEDNMDYEYEQDMVSDNSVIDDSLNENMDADITNEDGITEQDAVSQDVSGQDVSGQDVEEGMKNVKIHRTGRN